jgi:hypothetical protein
MPHRSSLLQLFLGPSDVVFRPKEAVNFGRNYPRVIIVESHPAFDGNWNFDGIVRWRMGDRNDVRYDTIWELRDLFAAKHDSTRAVLQPLNLFFLSFAMPEVRVAIVRSASARRQGCQLSYMLVAHDIAGRALPWLEPASYALSRYSRRAL